MPAAKISCQITGEYVKIGIGSKYGLAEIFLKLQGQQSQFTERIK